LLPKNKVKLLLNMCLIAAASIPRGGVIAVTIEGDGETTSLNVDVKSEKAVRVAHGVDALLRGETEGENDSIDAHGIQGFYTGLVARTCGMDIAITGGAEGVVISAVPAALENGQYNDQSAA